jgi:hypothetical protein
MARVRAEDDGVRIELGLADEILSLHGSFHIPYSHIAAVSTDPVPPAWFRGFRIGTNLPGIKVAGTFLTDEGVLFYDFRRPDRCLTLDLRHETYRRVVVEVDADQDRDAVAQEIRSRCAKAQR